MLKWLWEVKVANLNLKFKRTNAMKRDGVYYHSDHFTESARILDGLHRRRMLDKPIDGQCFREAGEAIKEAKAKRVGG
jgi:hypothetical protein